MRRPIDPATLDLLTVPQPRLPGLVEWLTREIWTADRFQKCGAVPSEYLKSGEKEVCEAEILLKAAADTYFGELAAGPSPETTIARFLKRNENACAVVLDGCSIREVPRLLELARSSRRPILECTCSRSALPSTTEHFVRDRLGFGLPALSPSSLPSRKELQARGVRFCFFHAPNESQHMSDAQGPTLVWHRFPDLRFMDSTASGAEFYDGVWDTLELVWQRTVQALPPSRPVLVTSDHGYVFLGPGLSDRSLDGLDRPLKGKRFREFADEEPLPADEAGLFIDSARRVAMIKGRCHNRPQAPSPAQSLYRHGGLTLMEVLTPWLVLGPVE